MALEAANGRGKGLNANKETCPEANKAVWQIVYGIIAYLEAEPRGSFTLKQPKGSALQHHAATKILEATLNITYAGGSAHVLVRVPVAEAHADLDEPGRLLGTTRPACALRPLRKQHVPRDEGGEARQGRPPTCCAAPRVHAGVLTEPDRPTACGGLEPHNAQEMEMDEPRLKGLTHRNSVGIVGPGNTIDHDTVTANIMNTSVHARNAWKSDDPGIGANKTTRAAIKKTRGVGRRVKQRAHWAEVCAQMMAVSTVVAIPPPPGPLMALPHPLPPT